MSDDQTTFLNQKSHFLTQLEQKDDISLMESLDNNNSSSRDVSSNPSVSDDRMSNDGESSSDEKDSLSNEKQHSVKVENLNKGDFQLAKLLEEEKMLGMGDGTDKIDETKCHKCNKRFYRRSQLIRHLSNHVVHECLHCNAVYYCVKKYKKHMSTHETYPCDFCNEEFFDASAWYQHRAKHTMMECSCCDMIFYNKAALAKHKFEHSEYICPLCRFACENLHHWISHRNYHGRCSLLQPIIACRECKLTFGSQEVFLKHKCTSETHGRKPAAQVILQTPPPPHHITKQKRLPSGNKKFIQHTSLRAPVPPHKPYYKERSLARDRGSNKSSYITSKSKFSRPEPLYFTDSKSRRMHGPQHSPLHFGHHQKTFKRMMNKKDIKDLIGVDQTLSCSS